MSVAIRVEKLGKKYLIRHKTGERYTALRDVLVNAVKQTGRRVMAGLKKSEARPKKREDFWALQDVSFEVKEGERLGIIGRNGAGKSTLLKILSRITEPSRGRALIKGRISSLLEVGTGFHPELTGRENIFLNGAILGMKKSEIKRKYDEIVDFAGIENFLDTPVKRYSSGMYVRLAFSVAAHLETEIMLIDEVLAVGDIQFQRKCLKKMNDISKDRGRSILFVSHNMNAIEELCTHCLLINSGRLETQSDSVRSVINSYLFKLENSIESEWINRDSSHHNPYFQPLRFALTDRNGRKLDMPVRNDADIFVQIEGRTENIDLSLTIGYALYSEEGYLLYWTTQADQPESVWPVIRKGENTIIGRIPKRFLNEGLYKLDLIVSLHFREWLCQPNKNSPSIFLNIRGGLSDSPYWLMKRPGICAPEISWKSQE